MSNVMLISVICLWGLVLLLLLSVGVLARQVGLLHRRIGPVGARMSPGREQVTGLARRAPGPDRPRALNW